MANGQISPLLCSSFAVKHQDLAEAALSLVLDAPHGSARREQQPSMS